MSSKATRASELWSLQATQSAVCHTTAPQYSQREREREISVLQSCLGMGPEGGGGLRNDGERPTFGPLSQAGKGEIGFVSSPKVALVGGPRPGLGETHGDVQD